MLGLESAAHFDGRTVSAASVRGHAVVSAVLGVSHSVHGPADFPGVITTSVVSAVLHEPDLPSVANVAIGLEPVNHSRNFRVTVASVPTGLELNVRRELSGLVVCGYLRVVDGVVPRSAALVFSRNFILTVSRPLRASLW